MLVPTFSSDFGVPPPAGWRLARNGWDYDAFAGPTAGIGRIYTPDTAEIDADMGAIPTAVLAMPGRVRGNHPLDSFTAVGPLARDLIAGQAPLRVFAPLEALAAAEGAVILMGVGLDKMTLLHLAEQRAGRHPFRRWANAPDGQTIAVETGGCSDGFGNLEPVLVPLARRAMVGTSLWRAWPAQAVLDAASAAIRRHPEMTHCQDPRCARCNDAVLGGPALPPPSATGAS
jgi:aminoglycoside 3-N-acetyltransferase